MGTGQHRHDHDGYCKRALAELYTFLDGELTEERRVVIEEHLDVCNPCLEAFDFEAELRMVIQHRCREEVPESLRDRIASALSDPNVLSTLERPPSGAAGADS